MHTAIGGILPGEEMLLPPAPKPNDHCKAYPERQTLYVWVRIPLPKIGKLACQAKGAGIFALGEYPSSAAKKFDKFRLVDFFIHCESNGISSRFSVYLIRFDEHISSKRVYHQPQAVSSFAMMIYNGKPLMIYNSFGIDDIHAFGVIWHDGLFFFPLTS